MNEGEPQDADPHVPSLLDATLENIVQVLKKEEEQAHELDKRKLSLEVDIAIQRKFLQQLELEKAVLDDEITTLKVRNFTFQNEHTNLRNAIKVIKFQIEKIEESIAKAKADDLRELEDFEKAVDEITEKFRSGPDIYDRRVLLEKIEKEKEKKDEFQKKLQEGRIAYENFNRENGLQGRTSENEPLEDFVLPGSGLFSLIEMTKTLDEVICQIKKLCKGIKQDKKDFKAAHSAK